jgi:hypothetical protein
LKKQDKLNIKMGLINITTPLAESRPTGFALQRVPAMPLLEKDDDEEQLLLLNDADSSSLL